MSEQSITPIQLREELEDGTVVLTDLAEAPLGTREIYTQHRMCGDFYCFIHGTRQVAAIGATLSEAFLNAVKQAA